MTRIFLVRDILDNQLIDVTDQNAGNASLLDAARARLPESLPHGVHARAVAGTQAFLLSVGPISRLGQITDFIPSDTEVIDNAAKPEIAKSGALATVRLRKAEQLNRPIGELKGLLITNDKAYNVAVPIAATKSSRKTSAPKHS